MRINSVSAYSSAGVRCKAPSFKATYVTLSKKNNADFVKEHVVDKFMDQYYPSIRQDKKVKEFQDEYGKNMNCFLLAAGEGSRFRRLAATQSPKTNKISYKYYLNNGKTFHMPDTNLARASHYMENDKINVVTAEDANGSLGQVIETYMRDNEPVKDTIIYCGDNQLHTNDPMEIDRFFVQSMKSGNKMALIAAKKTPEEVAGSLGCMILDNRGKEDDTFRLFKFEEKPPIEKALEFADETGYCYANAGMFVFSKDAMNYLIEEIKNDPKFIAKNDKEIYDFALAQQKILEKFGPNHCIVKAVDGDNWIDTGKPSDFQEFLESVRDTGKFLNVFSTEDASNIRQTFKDKVGKGYFINSSNYSKLKVKDLEGVTEIIGLDDGCTLIK